MGIIYELRFGIYSTLCIAHLDRFGFRTFYHSTNSDAERTEFHFEADLMNMEDIFNEVDMVGLSDFVQRKSAILDSTEMKHALSISLTETIGDNLNSAVISPADLEHQVEIGNNHRISSIDVSAPNTPTKSDDDN